MSSYTSLKLSIIGRNREQKSEDECKCSIRLFNKASIQSLKSFKIRVATQMSILHCWFEDELFSLI